MKGVLVLLGLLLAGGNASAQSIDQHSTGTCSPNVAGVEGSVTITCPGIPSKALERLNQELELLPTVKRLHELLEFKGRQLVQTHATLTEKLAEAEEWARRYRELEASLAAQAADDELAAQAEQALKQGDLERAGELLDRLLEKQEEQVDRIAATHFNRARVFQLQFEPLKALPHLEKAYRYRPDNTECAHCYAMLLQELNRFRQATDIYRKNLARLRELSKANPDAFLPDVAETLNNLAVLLASTERWEDARAAIDEAIRLTTPFAEAMPTSFHAERLSAMQQVRDLIQAQTARRDDQE